MSIYTPIATCENCRSTFTPTVGSYGRFCSLSCSSTFNGKILTEKATNTRILKEFEYNSNPTYCRCCSEPLPYVKRNNLYCTQSCAAKETNKIPRKRGPESKPKFLFSRIKFLWCPIAEQWYCNRNPDGSFRRKSPYVKTLKELYYYNARFKFNVYHFPEEFDLSLIEELGWYTCPGKKRKNGVLNVNGISRDHIISISYGFANGIDPFIIGHPANCRLMPHSDNKRKQHYCDMTLDELMVRIKEWEVKYASSG